MNGEPKEAKTTWKFRHHWTPSIRRVMFGYLIERPSVTYYAGDSFGTDKLEGVSAMLWLGWLTLSAEYSYLQEPPSETADEADAEYDFFGEESDV